MERSRVSSTENPRRSHREPSLARIALGSSFTFWRCLFILCLVSFGAGNSPAFADSTNLTPIADTTLSQNYPSNNFGGLGFANSGTTQNLTGNRALFKFDLAGSIPKGSKIKTASLVLSVTRTPADGFTFSDFGLHRLLRDWGEGNKVTPSSSQNAGTGSLATTNEATWFYRFAFTTNTWTSPGASATNDYVPATSSSQTIYGLIDSPYAFNSSALTVLDVQFWLDNPQSNFGWILVCNGEDVGFTARRFGSREDTNNTPQLLIDYDPPPPLIDRVQASGNQLNLFFTAASNQTYVVESRADVVSGNWQTLANVGPFPDTTRVLVVDPISQPRRFYRVRPN